MKERAKRKRPCACRGCPPMRPVPCHWGNCTEWRCEDCGKLAFSAGVPGCPCNGYLRWLRYPGMRNQDWHWDEDAGAMVNCRVRAKPSRARRFQGGHHNRKRRLYCLRLLKERTRVKPRCRRPLERRELPGRLFDPYPECGRPAGHGGQCLSRQAWQRELERSRRNGKGKAMTGPVKVPVSSRCSGLCAMHCAEGGLVTEVSLRDAGALMRWLGDGAQGTLTLGSSSRLSFEGSDGALAIRVLPR